MVNYTLHYFNGRGRAEISRLIFAAAGVEFTDHRIGDDWVKSKAETPLGQVPYLDIDEHTKLPQSLSIARYLAREYNLVGKNNLEAAKADSVVDTCIDLMTAFYNKVFLITDKAAKETALKSFLKDDAPKGLENIEKLISKFGTNGYSVGDQLTWADLFLYEITFNLINHSPNSIDNYELIKKVRQSVEKNEKVNEYLKKRPITPY